MKTTCLLPVILLLSSFEFASAQSEPKPAKKIRITEVSFQAGMIHQPTLRGSYNDFTQLAPNSTLMSQTNQYEEFNGTGTMSNMP